MQFAWLYGTEVSQRHADSVTGLLLTPDGNTVLSRSADGTLILWSAEGRNIRTFGKHAAGHLEGRSATFDGLE